MIPRSYMQCIRVIAESRSRGYVVGGDNLSELLIRTMKVSANRPINGKRSCYVTWFQCLVYMTCYRLGLAVVRTSL